MDNIQYINILRRLCQTWLGRPCKALCEGPPQLGKLLFFFSSSGASKTLSATGHQVRRDQPIQPN